MTLPSYALRVTAGTAVSLALLWPLLDRLGEPGWAEAAAFGAALCTINSVAAYFLVAWSQGRPTNTFMAAVLGGMLGRMALMLAAVVAGVLALGLPRGPLVASVMCYFTLLLVFELNVVNRTIRSEARAR